MSTISFIKEKCFKMQEFFESLLTEFSSGFKDGLAGKPKADHWVRYLQEQKRENDTMSKEHKE